MLDVMFTHCAGLDVHKKSVTACALVPGKKGKVRPVFKTFGTTTKALREMKAWLLELGVTHVAMESTGVYWKPVYNILQDEIEVWVVNAQHIKQVPGRKTDVKDAEWIATLMRLGLLNNSFIPDEAQRDLRDLTRYRTQLTNERSAAVNRVQKVLEDANIKLDSVVTDIQGVSARQMLAGLIEGQEDGEALAELAKGRMRHKIPELVAALTGYVRPHHRFMLAELLTHMDQLNQQLTQLNERIEAQTAPQADLIARLDEIPGVGQHTAEILLAEVGCTVEQFPSEKHLASWACLCPGNNISANKRRSGKTRKGQKWLRTALSEAAWAASRTKDTYLSAQFHRLRARRGAKRAAVAVAHSILHIVYHLMKDPTATFQELGGDYFVKRNKGDQKRRALKTLAALGYAAELTPVAG
jgi:transposase